MKRFEELQLWQEANYPVRMSEKVRLLTLPAADFEAELVRLEKAYREKRMKEGLNV